MTREEIIKELSVEYLGDSERMIKAKKKAIKAIEQESCEDAISREDVEECIELMTDINGDTVYAVRMSDIRQLSSVKPQDPKEGHWIIHPKGIYAHLICDKCLSNAPYDCRTNYCPNCGAKMKGGE